MSRETDIRVRAAQLYFLPVETRVPLKFGAQVVDRVVCARVRVRVEDARGRSAWGWGETPLSVGWVWPSALSWDERERRLQDFCVLLAKEVVSFDTAGHPLEVGDAFQRHRLVVLQDAANKGRAPGAELTHLAALVCLSLFDLAIFDAYGRLHDRPVFSTLNEEFISTELKEFFDGDAHFTGQWPADFLHPRKELLPVWHLVGGLDPMGTEDLSGGEPQDGYPLLLRDWIRRDGLRCLKVKLRGNEAEWDFQRMVTVGQIAVEEGCDWLSADFNCTVTDPDYVCAILDRLLVEHPRIYGMTLYIEQPFPYDLEHPRIDAHSISSRKPLFLDESAHDWRFVRLGRELGWNGVALKTCKTLSGALLSLCWARAHGMSLMVQDLTNPMLAQIPHVLLAAHAGTLMGVESNSMQFYPEASMPEARIHPGLFARRGGRLDLSTLKGPGFGYRNEEIERQLPPAACETGIA